MKKPKTAMEKVGVFHCSIKFKPWRGSLENGEKEVKKTNRGRRGVTHRGRGILGKRDGKVKKPKGEKTEEQRKKFGRGRGPHIKHQKK